MRNSLKFIDLFAGLGGFHLALSHLGCQCVFASELKEDLQKLYRENFPGTPILGDITKVSISDIPAHDILCGGFPCQPFSQAGKRQGFYDEKNRGNLFYYIADIIRNRKPRYVFLENVANLKGHDDGNTWDVIYHTLSDDLDYEVEAEVRLDVKLWNNLAVAPFVNYYCASAQHFNCVADNWYTGIQISYSTFFKKANEI